MALYNTPSVLPQRSTAFLAVVCLHISLVYLLASGLATRTIQLLAPPMAVNPVADKPLPRTPPPAPKPQLYDVTPEVPVVPEIPIDTAPEPATPVISTAPEAPVRPQERPAVVTVPGGVGKGFPNTDDFYPPSAIRLGQEGAAAVQVCVDETGRLSSEPTLAHSSSNASLDTAALRLARAGSGHYRATTQNGRPVSSCYAVSFRFNIKR